ncbi:hemin receptor [Solimonas sp. K1W22B-7]|uniref:globin family protein n=1 Tax=Solimonas sp. K1W22B-7 TaxID=2303331 RepID=UPI000E332AFB|nr:globin family protein [Solimonas sp. K1W22B-7]AXQ29191.1 hemin receptor [Solimonas sp. K1W22B-7]
MTPRQIKNVQVSFERIAPYSAQAAELFYRRLFMLDPALRPLFREDLVRHGQQLMDALAWAVRGLQDRAGLIASIQALGQRHAGYGARPEHYDTVGDALLWALQQGLGDEFSQEVRDAWVAAYALIAGIMLDAAAQKSGKVLPFRAA